MARPANAIFIKSDGQRAADMQAEIYFFKRATMDNAVEEVIKSAVYKRRSKEIYEAALGLQVTGYPTPNERL